MLTVGEFFHALASNPMYICTILLYVPVGFLSMWRYFKIREYKTIYFFMTTLLLFGLLPHYVAHTIVHVLNSLNPYVVSASLQFGYVIGVIIAGVLYRKRYRSVVKGEITI